MHLTFEVNKKLSNTVEEQENKSTSQPASLVLKAPPTRKTLHIIYIPNHLPENTVPTCSLSFKLLKNIRHGVDGLSAPSDGGGGGLSWSARDR